MLGFLFSLGFYDDSGVCSKYFPSRGFAISTHDGPLHKLGLLSANPRTRIHQTHLIRPVKLYFYPLQLKSKIQLPIHDHKLKIQVGNTETEPFFCDFCHTRCYSHRGRIKALKHSSIETKASEYNTTGKLTRMNSLKAGNNPVELSSLSLV